VVAAYLEYPRGRTNIEYGERCGEEDTLRTRSHSLQSCVLTIRPYLPFSGGVSCSGVVLCTTPDTSHPYNHDYYYAYGCL
jgi:hypothetical protein